MAARRAGVRAEVSSWQTSSSRTRQETDLTPVSAKEHDQSSWSDLISCFVTVCPAGLPGSYHLHMDEYSTSQDDQDDDLPARKDRILPDDFFTCDGVVVIGAGLNREQDFGPGPRSPHGSGRGGPRYERKA